MKLYCIFNCMHMVVNICAWLLTDDHHYTFTFVIVADKKIPISIAFTGKERNKNIFRTEMVQNILNIFQQSGSFLFKNAIIEF